MVSAQNSTGCEIALTNQKWATRDTTKQWISLVCRARGEFGDDDCDCLVFFSFFLSFRFSLSKGVFEKIER